MTAWATEEVQYALLRDVRRNKRLIRLVSDLAAQPIPSFSTSAVIIIYRL